jgi:transcriptional/translational regulatory protein YebC/TACO1
MGRMFEVRKHTMFARWNRMAKQFARIAKDITMTVKSGGPDPQSNPTLRRILQNARAVNMPKDKVEAAIKRASGRDATNYDEVLYEGYARHRPARRDRHRQPDPYRGDRAQRDHQERRQPGHQR